MIRSRARGQRNRVSPLVLGLAGLALSATAAGAQGACTGDCNGDGTVTINEIITIVNISLGTSGLAGCPAGDANGDGEVTVDEIIAAVNASLAGCAPTPTPTPTPTPPPGDGQSAVKSSITNVSIAANPAGQIAVTFTLTDEAGRPLTAVPSSAQGPQQARVRLTIAHVEPYSGGGEFNRKFDRYVNDIDPTRPRYDSGGTLETLNAATGLYRYVFKTQLPADYDPTRTYSVGMQVDRTVAGMQQSANPIYDFVPAGGTPRIRQGATTARCNSCHAPLILHGNRRELRLCTLCHTEAGVDEKGRSIDLRHMVHKIHRGRALPSIVDGPPGSTYAIFSGFAQRDIVFARKDEHGVITGIGFPRPIQNCTVCHADGATASYHHDRPSTAACAGCHDDVNPSLEPTAAGPPGTKHFQERGFADGDCAFCHVAESDGEFDVSVPGAHVIPERSRQLAGLNMEITGLRSHAAGQSPTISFRITDDAGTPLRDLSGLNRVAFTIAGPTTDYSAMVTATAVGGGASGVLAGPDDAGIFEYTPATVVPGDATGTWAVGAEARRSVQLATVDPITPKTVQEAAVNPVVTFSADGSGALVRRAVVEDPKCGRCHGEFSKGFSIHGNLRNQTEYCVLCHNPNQSDVARRQRDPAAVASAAATASIDFKVMIHKIHRGEELEHAPYLIYGFGSAPPNYTVHDFAEVLFPGDLRDCQTCHLPGTYLLPPFPGNALGTRQAHLDPATGDEVEDLRLGPITAVCTSCHDAAQAMAHAETQTTARGAEACRVCHGEGRTYAVSALHAGRR